MADLMPGMGGSFWTRRTNHEPGCNCPPARYDPTKPKPTNADCKLHGTKEQTNV
ncbi:hypothetical protein PP353_gp49 [Arthrobacter phage Kumotta]|uniref:Uncharacterized protein n=1 Tax=Arthrobacter phage Kumotta TaxID=2588498 RepID=A0A4Y6EUG6_9CAUD|nr:hypothetical protein PP353_gp49 [Arthrobacter phage Kumotta]QDF19559.1 hypothetical protein SEA_KUMOTTA_49 [Arthrobacter phage Kumotta]